MSRPRVGVIGAGRVGTVLAARLQATGHAVVAVTARSAASRRRAATLLPGVPVAEAATVAESCDLLLLTVPDDDLACVAASLADHVRPGQIVLHTSGRLGLAPLAPLAARGVRTIAFHPAMTFTGTKIDLDRRCVVGLTARESERSEAEELVAAVGGTPIWIAEADRVTYHAALAHGANHLVTLVGQSANLLVSIGIEDPSAVLAPLLVAALDNTLVDGDAALTGPVSRGDAETVDAHLRALTGTPETVQTYIALALATVARAERSGRLGAAGAAAVRAALTADDDEGDDAS